jgi:hypothetical protein
MTLRRAARPKPWTVDYTDDNLRIYSPLFKRWAVGLAWTTYIFYLKIAPDHISGCGR